MTKLGHKLQLLDVPNARSNHVQPKPRMGGVAFTLAFLIGVFVLAFLGFLKQIWSLPILIGGIPVALIGFMDDLKPRSSALRLSLQLAIAIFTFGYMTEWFNTSLDMTFMPDDFAIYFEISFAVLFIAWMINLFNFMDGIDGIAGSQALVVAAVSAGFCIWQQNWQLFSLYALVVVSVAGFLVFNWAPAKIFMGDCGSYFLGFTLACLALMNQIYSAQPVTAQLILMGVFIGDATYTLAIRFLRKTKVSQAHKDHGYQHLVAGGRSHAKATLILNAITLFWLAPLAALSMIHHDWAIGLLVVSYLPILAILFLLRAGIPLESKV